MAYRYCPACKQWLSTSEYTVGETGETICPEHTAVHGYIGGGMAPISRKRFRHEHPSWYDDREEMLSAAKEQGLVR